MSAKRAEPKQEKKQIKTDMNKGFHSYGEKWGENALLAWDTLAMKPTRGICTWFLNVMDWDILEQVGGSPTGSYSREPETVYLEFQIKAGACMCDQWIPRNPLGMRSHGYESSTKKGATTGLDSIVVDGMKIDSPEAVVEHLERVEFPKMIRQTEEIDVNSEAALDALIEPESRVQDFFGMNMLKCPYGGGFQSFPYLRYTTYGYENYFMAYALFPDLMEKDFALQADLAVKKNTLAAKAILRGGLPRLIRLDHDMADSRGTLVDINSLDKIWFPSFVKSIAPLLKAGIRLIWHCDGNLMGMVPRLLDAGLGGFQGFQYEDGMDYEKISRMKDRNGDPLFIEAGVSVTRTLPNGTGEDVRRELKWLVESGPRVGLVLGASSSVAPNTNPDNIRIMIEGLKYYRERGRD